MIPAVLSFTHRTCFGERIGAVLSLRVICICPATGYISVLHILPMYSLRKIFFSSTSFRYKVELRVYEVIEPPKNTHTHTRTHTHTHKTECDFCPSHKQNSQALQALPGSLDVLKRKRRNLAHGCIWHWSLGVLFFLFSLIPHFNWARSYQLCLVLFWIGVFGWVIFS